MPIIVATILLSSALLFLVQPLLARLLLPWYGGAAMVWITCVLFFQCFLFVGYLYAHWLSQRVSARGQLFVHGTLLIASALFLPVHLSQRWKWTGEENPSYLILFALISTISIPYLLLSSTNPLVQSWTARLVSSPSERQRVYRLFALSNLGSLLALLSYPFVIEPFFSLSFQTTLWSFAYVIFLGLCALVTWRAHKTPLLCERLENEVEVDSQRWALLAWLALPCLGSIVLLATTNQLTRNVASVPFLWVVPLALYLASFIIVFEGDRWYRRAFWIPLFLIGLVATLYLLKERSEPDFKVQLVGYLFNQFVVSVVLHGELARWRPSAVYLTKFYLFVAAGGAIGGVLVSLVAPRVFSGFFEFPLSLFAAYVLIGVSMLLANVNGLEGEYLRWSRSFWLCGAFTFVLVVLGIVRDQRGGPIFMERSFFGNVRVYDRNPGTNNWRRDLWNGPIGHGTQLMAEGRHLEPTLYYTKESGIYATLDLYPLTKGRRVAVIGLGAGTLAALGRAGDEFRFYELDINVVQVADSHFFFLNETPANVEVILGDGRISLERELKENGSLELDILVLDAFAGDAIPVHLLTLEAFTLYDQHLKTDGVIAVHISNLHFDLSPVVRAAARHIDSAAVLLRSDSDTESEIYSADWVVVTRNADLLSDPQFQKRITPWILLPTEQSSLITWTDDYVNLLGLMN